MSHAFQPTGDIVPVSLTAQTSLAVALPPLDPCDGSLIIELSSGTIKFGDSTVSISSISDGYSLSDLPNVIRPTPGATHIAFYVFSGNPSFKFYAGRGGV